MFSICNHETLKKTSDQIKKTIWFNSYNIKKYISTRVERLLTQSHVHWTHFQIRMKQQQIIDSAQNERKTLIISSHIHMTHKKNIILFNKTYFFPFFIFFLRKQRICQNGGELLYDSWCFFFYVNKNSFVWSPHSKGVADLISIFFKNWNLPLSMWGKTNISKIINPHFGVIFIKNTVTIFHLLFLSFKI